MKLTPELMLDLEQATDDLHDRFCEAYGVMDKLRRIDEDDDYWKHNFREWNLKNNGFDLYGDDSFRAETSDHSFHVDYETILDDEEYYAWMVAMSKKIEIAKEAAAKRKEEEQEAEIREIEKRLESLKNRS